MHPLIGRLQAPRSIRAHALRLVLVRTVGSVVLASMVLYGQSLVFQNAAELQPVPATTPTWSTALAGEYPGCIDADDWPPNTWGAAVIGYQPEVGRTSRIDFDQAWERTHNALEADDLVVLGICS